MPKPIHFPLSSDAAHAEYARRMIREALAVLATSQTDTFLGRKSHDPFPKETLNLRDGQGDAKDHDR